MGSQFSESAQSCFRMASQRSSFSLTEANSAVIDCASLLIIALISSILFLVGCTGHMPASERLEIRERVYALNSDSTESKYTNAEAILRITSPLSLPPPADTLSAQILLMGGYAAFVLSRHCEAMRHYLAAEAHLPAMKPELAVDFSERLSRVIQLCGTERMDASLVEDAIEGYGRNLRHATRRGDRRARDVIRKCRKEAEDWLLENRERMSASRKLPRESPSLLRHAIGVLLALVLWLISRHLPPPERKLGGNVSPAEGLGK